MSRHQGGSLERALAEQRKLKGDTGDPEPRDPLSQWCALAGIERKRSKIEGGDSWLLFTALRRVLIHGVVAPEWLIDCFDRGYLPILRYKVGSWDEAFGRPNPKGLDLKAAAKRRRLQPAVYVRIRKILNTESVPIDDGLFERVAEEFEIKPTLVKKLYYSFPLSRPVRPKLPRVS